MPIRRSLRMYYHVQIKELFLGMRLRILRLKGTRYGVWFEATYEVI